MLVQCPVRATVPEKVRAFTEAGPAQLLTPGGGRKVVAGRPCELHGALCSSQHCCQAGMCVSDVEHYQREGPCGSRAGWCAQ